MPPTRRNRRLILASALIAVLAFAWVLNRPSADSAKFYAFLNQHPWLAQVVRVGFVLAGKQDEFDVELAFASIQPIIIYDYDGPGELEVLDLQSGQLTADPGLQRPPQE